MNDLTCLFWSLNFETLPPLHDTQLSSLDSLLKITTWKYEQSSLSPSKAPCLKLTDSN